MVANRFFSSNVSKLHAGHTQPHISRYWDDIPRSKAVGREAYNSHVSKVKNGKEGSCNFNPHKPSSLTHSQSKFHLSTVYECDLIPSL